MGRMERWLPVVGYEDLYAVSSRGRVLGLRRQALLNPFPTSKGGSHLFVYLYRDGKSKLRDVAHLVLEAHVGPRPEGAQCCHRDDDGDNNALSNLYWGTHQSNSADRERNNTHCPAGHEYTEENTYQFTRKDGRREKHCRQCRRDRAYANYRPSRGRHSGRHGSKSNRGPRPTWPEVGRDSYTSP